MDVRPRTAITRRGAAREPPALPQADSGPGAQLLAAAAPVTLVSVTLVSVTLVSVTLVSVSLPPGSPLPEPPAGAPRAEEAAVRGRPAPRPQRTHLPRPALRAASRRGLPALSAGGRARPFADACRGAAPPPGGGIPARLLCPLGIPSP